MAEVARTEEALRWLQDIFEYVAADNPSAASRTVEGIYEASPRHVRILLYGHYRIAYLVKDDGNVEILGAFHGALDITRYRL